MNKASRKQISDIVNKIEALLEVVRALAEDEQEKFDNLSEGSQQSENGQAIERAASRLNEAADNLELAFENLDIVS